MTEPVKRRMLLFVDPNARVPYVPKDYRDLPVDQQPKFLIRPLPSAVYEMRRDLITRNGNGALDMAMGSWIMLALRHGLVGAEGPGTVAVVLQDDEVPTSYLDRMSPPLRAEIARAIEGLCTLGPDNLFD